MTVVFVGEFTGCIEFVKIYKWMLSESAKKKKEKKTSLCFDKLQKIQLFHDSCGFIKIFIKWWSFETLRNFPQEKRNKYGLLLWF